MKKIPIRNKKGIVVYAIIDDEDYEKINKHKWYRTWHGYACTITYEKTSPTHHTMHRMIMGIPPKGMMVDHIDRNKMNNCRNNLRFVTCKLNAINAKLQSRRKLPFKGVYKSSKGKLYFAAIRINGKTKHLANGPNPKELYENHFVPAYIKLYGIRPIDNFIARTSAEE